MRADWNEELRRAYDQGYWDARREFEHHLALMHQGRAGGNGPMQQGFGGRGEGGYGEPQDYRGQGPYRQSGGGAPNGGRGGYRGEGPADHGRGDRRGAYPQGSPMEHRGGGQDGRGWQGDYPPGDRRQAFEGGGGRGFFDRVGDEVRSWFGDDRDERQHGRYDQDRR